MKLYTYKIQWLFNNNSGDVKNCINVIKAIGSKSLTVINFLDENYKRVDNYSGMISYPSGAADVVTIKYIKKICKNEKIRSIELLRR
jgi:hypothetical protein